jgi:predicted O-linked N-acetylglucosamine transferase (SPINDLY family)
MKQNNKKYRKLFEEKKYSELIFLIETSKNENELLAGEHNLLGVSRLLIQKNKENILLSLKNFENAYLKEKTTKIGLDGLKNYINLKVDLYKFSNSEIDVKKTLAYFHEAKKYWKYDKNLMLAIKRFYWCLNEVDKVQSVLAEMIKNQDHDSTTICSYIYSKGFDDDWSQINFFSFSKFLQQKTTTLKSDVLIDFKSNRSSKLKLGFVSGDIRSNHSVTYFLKTVLLNYDKGNIEIYLYFNHEKDDDITDEFKKLVFKSKNINKLNDIEAINFIRNDEIDIAFDLMGATSAHRESLFKNRIARTQVNWIGYCNTMGLSNNDYILADPNLIHKNEEHLYSEKIIYLPQIWNCHSGLKFERKEAPIPFEKKKYITFGSFNNFCKINDSVINTWSEILKKVKNSKLILKPSGRSHTLRLKNAFKKNGVENSVIFYDNIKSIDDHLKLYNEIDIALDTFPYNGVTTSFEAIWMGVPVLTMKGYNFNSRCGESINNNMDLANLIANDKNDYVNIALNISKNINKLALLRKKIFQNAIQSPLFNTKNFSKNFFDIVNYLKNKS